MIQVESTYLPYIGGIGMRVKQLSEGLVKRGVDVEVYTIDHKGICKEWEKSDGVIIRRFRGFSPGKAYRFSYGIFKALKRAKADIVHAYNIHSFLPFLAVMAKKYNKSKFVLTPAYHGQGHTFFRNLLFQPYRRLIGNFILKKCDLLISPSVQEKNMILSDFKSLKIPRLKIIPCSINVSLYNRARAPRNESTPKLLFVGRLEKYKGVQFILYALQKLVNDFDVSLWIVGDGQYKPQLKKLVKDLKISRYVFFSDKKGEEVIEEYLSADLVVTPSIHEAFNLVAIEALASGTPVLTSTQGEALSLIKKRLCVGLDNPMDIDEIYEKIKAILSGEITLNMDSIREQILRTYSTERITDLTLEAYEQLLL